MIPSSKTSDRLAGAALAPLVVVLVVAGCAAETLGPADASTRRHPDGVAIDPIGAPPPARARAETADGLVTLVTLRTPLGADRAVAMIDDLFRAIVLEDADGLAPLFVKDAQAVVNPGAGGGQTLNAVNWWVNRFRKLDYTRLAGETIYREAELRIYRAEDATEAPPHPAIRVEALVDNDVVVRVPILTSRIGADRLFGDEMILWFRREGDRFKIYRVLEDFQLN